MKPLLVLCGSWAASLLAGVVTLLVVALSGGRGLTPAAVLLFTLLWGGCSLAVLWRVEPLPLEQLGLRAVPPKVAAAAVAAGLATIAVLAALAQPAAAIPRELSHQDAFARALGDPDPTAVAAGAGTLVSIFARAVLAVVVLEVLLRGYALPAFARRLGTPAATAAVAVVFGAAGPGLAGDASLLLPAMLLGAVLCWLRLDTGSILPGAGIAAAATGAVLAAGFGWGTDAVALTGLCCAGAAALLLGGPIRAWDLRPARS